MIEAKNVHILKKLRDNVHVSRWFHEHQLHTLIPDFDCPKKTIS